MRHSGPRSRHDGFPHVPLLDLVATSEPSRRAKEALDLSDAFVDLLEKLRNEAARTEAKLHKGPAVLVYPPPRFVSDKYEKKRAR